MSVQGDNLKIPIEIKTDDLNEIRKLINDITEAEIDLKSIKPRRGRGKGDDSSRSAFAQDDDDRGGIFGGQQGYALPTQGRDKTSKTPVQKENQFAKLQQDVAQQEQKISGLSAVQGGLGGLQQGIGYASLLGGPSGGTKTLGAITKLAGAAFLPLTVVTTIIGIANTLIKSALAPGGPFDIRFKRNLSTEISSATEREDKHKIQQSLKYIRITSYGGQRAQAYSGNGEAFKAGIPMHDIGLESRAKGLQW